MEISLQSFLPKQSDRRKTYLRLAGDIESQLRDAFDRQYNAGLATQSSLADKLGVNRSAVHHRLMGRTNMTIETIADMVWALGCKITVKVSEAALDNNHPIGFDDNERTPAPPPKTDGTQKVELIPA